METVRIDKWLWAARFFKSRQMAQEAILGGKVHLNGSRVKPSCSVILGDKLHIRKEQYIYEIEIRIISDKRVAAKIVRNYYIESLESIENRESMALQLKAQSLYTPKTNRRPDKKSRRKLIDIKKA